MEFMKSPKASDWVRNYEKVGWRWCILCGGIPPKIASYDYRGAIRIEQYCDSCAEKQFCEDYLTKNVKIHGYHIRKNWNICRC